MRLGPLILLPLLVAQQPIAPEPTQTAIRAAAQSATTDYIAQREKALAPALQFMRQGNDAAALASIRTVLTTYPHDLRVLVLAGDAARGSGKFQDAISYFQQSIDLNSTHAGVLRLGLVRTYADMGHWEEFNRERAVVSTLARNGDPSLSAERGYVIEDHRAGDLHIEVLEFSSTDPSATTRYRFLFVSSRNAAARFTPSIDLESNPSDATSFVREFPHQAAAHVRPYALISYPDAHSRGFLKFYSEGEPPYEDVHADVLTLAATFPKSSPTTIEQPHRRSYHAPQPATPQP
jgi:tetratricopeptide (TPR) repeat protein